MVQSLTVLIEATIGESSGTYLEAGFDIDLFKHAVSFRYLNLDNQSTIVGQLQGFDGQNFGTGTVFDLEVFQTTTLLTDGSG